MAAVKVDADRPITRLEFPITRLPVHSHSFSLGRDQECHGGGGQGAGGECTNESAGGAGKGTGGAEEEKGLHKP